MSDSRFARRRFLLQLAALLAVTGVTALVLEQWTDRTALEQATLERARAHFRDIVLTRRWAAGYGGVYVEKRPGIDANPHLQSPDLVGDDGKTYTLRIPAQITREISELAGREGDYRFHITALKLRNAANAPDAWEREALNAFEQGTRERHTTIVNGDRTEFRYMAPLYMEEACLQCHAGQGYQVGDVRGGISVRFDISPVLAASRNGLVTTGLTLLAAVIGVFFFARNFAYRLDRRLQRLGRRYEDLVQSIDGIVWEAELSPLRPVFVSKQAEALLGYAEAELQRPGFWADHVHPDDRDATVAAYERCARNVLPIDIEYRMIASDGRIVWLHDRVIVISEDGQPTRLRGLATDVTSRRLRDDQVRELLAEKDSILDNALVGIVHLQQRRVVACNRRFEEIFGYGPGELTGQSTRVLYQSEEIFRELGDRAYAALGHGSSYTEETQLRRKDGRGFWGALTGRAIDPSRPQDGSIWIYADVSERRQAEEEVHKLLRAVEQSPVSIVITDRDGRIEYVNPRFTRVTGYTLDEVIGRNPRLLQSGETPAETYRELWETVLAGREWRGVLHNRRKNGELFWEEATISPIVNERLEITHLLAVKEDISERTLAEKALSESHEAYLRLLDTTLDGFLLVDARGQVLDVNATYVNQSGYSHAELLEMRVDALEAAPADNSLLERLERIVACGSDRFESIHRRRDGSLWDVEVSVSHRSTAGGQCFVFLRDISTRKDVQRQIENQQEHLEKLVAQRTADLAAALQAATVADKAKDAFLANVSHELRTPLNAVIGLAGLALRNAGDGRQRDTLAKIRDSGQTLLQLVNDLLDLSKIAAGEMRFESTPFSLRELVERVRAAMAVRADEKGLQLGVQVAHELPAVLAGDPLRVEQILLNLVSNALKFTVRGQVDIRVTADARGDRMLRLVIEVEDTGIGLGNEQLASLFRPFAQADASVTRLHGGTGLGLAICKRLAEGMNGSIEVDSRPGSGSTFRVRLWLGVADPALLPVTAAAREPSLPDRYENAHVLVVDDQPLNLEVVGELLETVGITPAFASNGREALELLSESGPGAFDLVMMDIQMPVLDGLSATREIRRMPGHETLPVIAMTAHTMVHERAAYLDAGMSDHIGKPFTTEGFFRLLARWLPTRAMPAAAPSVDPPVAAAAEPQEVDAALPGDPVARLREIADLDPDAALARFVGNVDRYLHWLRTFADESPAALAALRDAAAGDREAGRKAAHAFKGRAGMLGLTNLHELASRLEIAFRDGADAAAGVEALAKASADTCARLRPVLGDAPASEAPAAEADVARSGETPESITRILGLLEAADGSSAVAIEQCLGEVADPLWRFRLRAAHSHVRRFDFGSARKALATPPEAGR